MVGREELLEAWLDSRHRVSVLFGDSGTGKSTLLAEAQARLGERGDIAPAAVMVSRAPGSLQRALLESLGAALVELAKDEAAITRVTRVLLDAGSRVLDMRFAELRGAVGRSLLGILRSKLGDHAADAVEDFATALTQAADESLAERMRSAGDNDVVDQLASFAAELAELADGRNVSLALDDVHQLDGSDQRRLADLCNAFDSGVQLRLAFAVWDQSGRSAVDQLVVAGAQPFEVFGLDGDALVEWVEREGLDATVVPALEDATSGYPLYVGDAIELIRESGTSDAVRELRPDDVLIHRTRIAWRELDPGTQAAALKLAVYSYPLSPARACRALSVELAEWWALRERLADSGFLLRTGTRWFHDLRRRALWDSVAPAEMRAAAYASAGRELRDTLRSSGAAAEVFMDFAAVAAQSGEVRAIHSSVDAVLEASRDEIALLASVLELLEDYDAPALSADGALMHASKEYGIGGDPVDVLARLEERELVLVVANEHASVIVPRFGCVEAVDIVMGRAARELARLPIEKLASSILQGAVAPTVGEFAQAEYGIGDPKAATMAESIRKLITQPSPGRHTYIESGSGLLIRARWSTVPFYASFSFNEPSRAHEASALLGRQSARIRDHDVDLVDLICVPGEPVASIRFPNALRRAVGARFSSSMPRGIELDSPPDLEQRLEAKMAAYAAIATLCDEVEQFAYDLRGPRGFAFHSGDRDETIVELLGKASVDRLDESAVRDLFGPYGSLRLRQLLQLAPSATTGNIETRSGRFRASDPVSDMVVELMKSAKAFNRAQTSRRIPLRERDLQDAIAAAILQTFRDAQVIAPFVSDELRVDLKPRDYYFLIEHESADPGWAAGSRSSYVYVQVDGDASHDRAFVKMTDAAPAGSGGWDEMFARISSAFEVEFSEDRSQGSAGVNGGLQGFLSHDHGEIRFVHASGLD